MDENRIVRTIPCKDAAKRDRQFQVVATPGGFTLVAPPGGSGTFQPRQYEDLHRAILEVLPIAWSQPPGPPQ